MELKGERIVIRPWCEGDEEDLVRHANDREVWRNLSDRFPHPYTLETAKSWIERCRTLEKLALALAIEAEGEAIGGIGLEPKEDIYQRTAVLGYWLGRDFWGQGIATEAVRLMVDYGFHEAGFARIQATVFEWNPASARVLEKAGFRFEARLRKAAFKDGELIDTMLYALIDPAL